MTYENNAEIYSAHNFFTNGKGTVTLCGSTKYFEQCMEINRRMTFQGWVVLMCGSWGHSYHKNAPNDGNHDYSKVKKLHFTKMLISDAIIIVSDKTGYYGDSTKAEIKFAEYHKIPVFYFDGEYLTGETTVKPYDSFSGCLQRLDEYVNETGNSLGF